MSSKASCITGGLRRLFYYYGDNFYNWAESHLMCGLGTIYTPHLGKAFDRVRRGVHLVWGPTDAW